MQKTDESYFLDTKLLNNLKQSTQLQSQLKVFLYKDIDLIASKNNPSLITTPGGSSTLTPSSNQIFPSTSSGGTNKPSRKTKRNVHDPLNQTNNINLNNKELQDYLLMILQFSRQSEYSKIIFNLKLFLEDSANFFIIENSSRSRQQKLKYLQQQQQQSSRQTKYNLARIPSAAGGTGNRRFEENFLFSSSAGANALTGPKGKAVGGLFNTVASPAAANPSSLVTAASVTTSSNQSRANETYEQQTYLNFLESSFNTNAMSSLPPITEIYDHNLLKKEIRQLKEEKESLLEDIKKCLTFNYFYDHSELTTLNQQVNAENAGNNYNTANSLLGDLGTIDPPVLSNNNNNNVGTVGNSGSGSVGLNYSNSSGLLFPVGAGSTSPSKDIISTAINITPNKTSTTASASREAKAASKANKHGISYYRIYNSDTLKFLYLISKYQYGKSILKSKKTTISSKSGEYLTKVYNLRMKTVNQLNWEITGYEHSIQRLKDINEESLEIIGKYYQELKEIDNLIIKQSQIQKIQEKILQKEEGFQQDSERLKALNEKLKGIIKNALIDIKLIYNNTMHSPVKPVVTTTVTSPSTPTNSQKSQKSPAGKEKTLNSSAAKEKPEGEVFVERSVQNTDVELSLFRKEVNEKMQKWYDLTLKSLEKKKSLMAALEKGGEIKQDQSKETNNRSSSVTVGQDDSLRQKYQTAKTNFEDHSHSLQKIHQLNDEIRERIIQESEKNHAKYDYYLKLQQNQYQSRLSQGTKTKN